MGLGEGEGVGLSRRFGAGQEAEFVGFTRLVLPGEFGSDMRGADFLEAFVHHALGEVGQIALAAEMTKIQMMQIGGHDGLGGVGGVGVRQVAVAAGDTLLETPGPRRFLQQLEIVIGFEHEDVGGADALENAFGGVAEVGHETNVAGMSAQQKTHGIGGVVWEVERFNDDIADFKALAGFEDAAMLEFDVERELRGIAREAIAINGDLEFGTKRGEAVDVVGVLMGDENAGEPFRRAADGGEPLAKLAETEPGIDEDAGIVGFQVSAIAAGTAAENGQTNSHRATLDSARGGSNVFRRVPVRSKQTKIKNIERRDRRTPSPSIPQAVERVAPKAENGCSLIGCCYIRVRRSKPGLSVVCRQEVSSKCSNIRSNFLLEFAFLTD